MSNETKSILTEREDGIATVILNRPDNLNALNKEMWAEVGKAFQAISADDSVRCVILRGAGEKAMGAGADIAEFAEQRNDSAQAAVYGGLMHGSMGAIRDCPHPVVAQIHGICVGGALELALMCDMRICGEGSRFGVPINKLGLVMAYPEVQALVGLVGQSVALEILYEGRVFGAAEAKEKGLVNRIVADEDVAKEVRETAERISAGAPLVNRWHKHFANRVTRGLATGWPLTEAEEAEGFACFDTEDFQEGVSAFLEKRKPDFKGK